MINIRNVDILYFSLPSVLGRHKLVRNKFVDCDGNLSVIWVALGRSSEKSQDIFDHDRWIDGMNRLTYPDYFKRLQNRWCACAIVRGFFFNTIFVSSHMYLLPREPRRDPSNRRLYEHEIYIQHCHSDGLLIAKQ